MQYADLVHRNKPEKVLVQLTKKNQVIYLSNSYKLRQPPFDYFMHYDVIYYVWADRNLGPHTLDCNRKCGKYLMIKHDPV